MSSRPARRCVFALLVALLAVLGATSCAPKRSPPPVEVQLQSFEYAWTRIRDTYPDPGFHGVDWNAVHQELLPQAQAARSAEALRPVLDAMFLKLGDSHFAVIPGSAASADGAYALPVAATTAADGPAPATTAVSAEGDGRGEVGVDVRLVGDRVLVSRVDAQGSAAEAGLRLGDTLDSLGGVSVSELVARIRAYTTDSRELGLMVQRRVLGWFSGDPGASVHVVVRGADDAPRELDIPFRETDVPWTTLGSLPPMPVHTEQRLLSPGPVGYFRFDAFVEPAPERFTEAMRAFLAASVRGVILDLRGNPGGVAPMAMGMAGHLIGVRGQSLGTMQFRDMTLRLVVNPRAERIDGPVAVLVDGLSASSSEILAAGLQKLGRARVFGEPSSGMALPSTWEALPNGDLIQFVTADFTDPTGARLEQAGVRPDELAPLTREALLAGRDPALDAALAWINLAPSPESP